ncbi:glutathione S-transferase family protein [Leptolyngbya sp. FACHB-711]|uniref:glutathione S-transferase family protein n=1 Tax=unclassified Leptolyngbya TaxID=2650499 RepID=UPI001688FCF2|nr:glutathione S-transferase family protein [Leptolyngbya sp. FACHB-711]MBD2023658.1 glutathione S-transferase family protein [Leptolyngbya sp. FACHB-711]
MLTLIIGNKNYSSWSLRAWLTLKYSGLPFTEIRLPLDTPEFYDRISQYSPSARVPVLLHDDLRVWESIAIGEYIAELAPASGLLPADSAVRAVVRSVSAEMHAGFFDLRRNLPMDCRSRYSTDRVTPSVQKDIDRISQIWRDCRQQYRQQGSFLFGNFTIADAMYAPVVSRFVTYNVKLDSEAQTYADAIWTLPLMQEWVEAATQELEVIPPDLLFAV